MKRIMKVFGFASFAFFTIMGASAIANWYARVNGIEFSPTPNPFVDVYRGLIEKIRADLDWIWPNIPSWVMDSLSIWVAMTMASRRGIWLKERILARRDYRKDYPWFINIIWSPLDFLIQFVMWPVYVLLLLLEIVVFLLSFLTVPIAALAAGEGLSGTIQRYRNNIEHFQVSSKESIGPWLIVMYQGVSIGLAIVFINWNFLFNR